MLIIMEKKVCESITLFINKRFVLNEMFQRNALKFAIFYVPYENPKLLFPFFISHSALALLYQASNYFAPTCQ